jgi:hypothetical protein
VLAAGLLLLQKLLREMGGQKVTIACQQQHVQLLLKQQGLLWLLLELFRRPFLQWLLLLLLLLLRLRLHEAGHKCSPTCEQHMPTGLHN